MMWLSVEQVLLGGLVGMQVVFSESGMCRYLEFAGKTKQNDVKHKVVMELFLLRTVTLQLNI